jgi:hypothetical protein
MIDQKERIEELKRKIVSVCIQCPHMNKRTLRCNAKGGHCNSKRVKKWRAQLQAMEARQNTGGD